MFRFEVGRVASRELFLAPADVHLMTPLRASHWSVPLISLVPLFVAGCAERRSAAQVSGTITLRGQPLADIGVNFEPIGSGAGRGSFGRTDASGHYSLQF